MGNVFFDRDYYENYIYHEYRKNKLIYDSFDFHTLYNVVCSIVVVAISIVMLIFMNLVYEYSIKHIVEFHRESITTLKDYYNITGMQEQRHKKRREHRKHKDDK